MTKIYTDRSNANRAARKFDCASVEAVGNGTFRVVVKGAAEQEADMRRPIGIVAAPHAKPGIDAVAALDSVSEAIAPAAKPAAARMTKLAQIAAMRAAKAEAAHKAAKPAAAAQPAAKAPAKAQAPAKAVKPASAKPDAVAPAKAGKKAEAWAIKEAAADRGELPAEIDLSAPTHASYRKRYEAMRAAVKAGDAAALRAIHNDPISSTRKLIEGYRILALRAMAAQPSK